MRTTPSFILRFQEPVPTCEPHATNAGTATHTLTGREDPDTDDRHLALATTTFTRTREEPDQDSERFLHLFATTAADAPLGIQTKTAAGFGTQTRTDAREEADQDRAMQQMSAIPAATVMHGRQP